MSTDWIASVRPVKSTKSVTSRTIGLLTGIETSSEGAIGGGIRAQPERIARVAQSPRDRKNSGEVMAGGSHPSSRKAPVPVAKRQACALEPPRRFRYILRI